MIDYTNKKPSNILLADDGSPNMRPAILLLADLPFSSECSVTALRVFTPLEGSEFSRVEAEAQKTTNLLKSRHFHFHSKLVQGYPADVILHYAGQFPPDLIVLGSKSTGTFGGMLGNVASSIVHHGKWPVLVVRGEYKGIRRVLLVTDGSPASKYTCNYLRNFPIPQDALVEIMHVVLPVRITYPVEPAGLALPAISQEEEAQLNEQNNRRGRELLENEKIQLAWPGETKLVLRMGEPLDEILKYAKTENIDLLVCGSRGAGNFTEWLMGSISRELFRQAPCPVLVVRTPPPEVIK